MYKVGIMSFEYNGFGSNRKQYVTYKIKNCSDEWPHDTPWIRYRWLGDFCMEIQYLPENITDGDALILCKHRLNHRLVDIANTANTMTTTLMETPNNELEESASVWSKLKPIPYMNMEEHKNDYIEEDKEEK